VFKDDGGEDPSDEDVRGRRAQKTDPSMRIAAIGDGLRLIVICR
jgi:hypothetical protein